MINLNVNKAFETAISEIASVSGQLPGVVIIHDLEGAVIWMSERGLDLLGISEADIPNITADEYYARFFNEDDAKDYVPRLLALLERNNNEEIVTYFQQVKYKNSTDWSWHMSSTRIWLRDAGGSPQYLITMSFPIDAMHHMTAKAERLLEENNFLRKNYHEFAKLSKRECEILRLMALGKSSQETAEELFIAVGTVETHRKNIRQKLNTSSFYQLCQYARAFDLI